MASSDRDPLTQLGPAVFAALRRERLSAGLAAHLAGQGYRTTHDPATGRVLATDVLDHTTRFDPDHQGFVGTVTSPLGRRWQLENDCTGRLTGLTDPAGTRLTIGYDERGRPVALGRAGGSAFRLAYDGADNLTAAQWPDGTRETFAYQDYRLLVACTDRAGGRETYDYDAANRLTAVTDGNGAVTRFEYGPWARPTAAQFPDGRRETYAWTPSPQDPQQARLAALGDAAGDYARLDYCDGRISAIHYRDGEQVSFRHDAGGRVIEAKVGDSGVHFTYDEAGRLLSEETEGARIDYRYDAAGNLIGCDAPTGSIGYTWNADLELAAIRAWDGSTATLSDSPDGRTCETRYAERLVSRRVRTGGGQLNELEVSAAGQRIYAARYAYDDEDRLTATAETGAPVRRYAYDAAGRLAALMREDGAEHYAYDSAGHRRHAGSAQASYDAAGKVLTSASARLVYDDRGRVIERSERGTTWHYQWNDRGLLTAARASTGASLTFDYDAFARRIAKHATDAGGQVTYTYFLWAGEQLIAEMRQGPEGVSRRNYLWYPGSHSLFAVQIDGAIYFACNDHLGCTRRLIDAWGRTAWAADLDPWGDARIANEPIDLPWRLPGQYCDVETGLHYNRFRYYDPRLGRYLSPDPLGLLAGFDPYAYAANDPINGADPLGLWTWAGVAKVAAVVVASVAVAVAVIALAPLAAPLALIAAGAAAGAVGFGLNEALNQEQFCLKCIAKAALKGALVGAAASLPFLAVPASAGIAAFAAAGGTSGAIGYALGTPPSQWTFTGAATTIVISAATAGGGRYLAGRLNASNSSEALDVPKNTTSSGIPGALSNQLRTKPNEAVFWSGRTEGVGGSENAAIIGGDGRSTLENLITARSVEMPVWDPASPSSVAAWENASKTFAQGASGEVKAVIGQQLRPGNIWETVELPALKANPSVTKITQVDPKTGVETIIFSR